MKEIKVVVDILKDGNVTIDVDGAEGSECLDLTKDLEEKLGGDINRKMKPESSFFQINTKKELKTHS